LTFDQAMAKAKIEKKPLILWVGCMCPAYEEKLKDVVHCYSEDFPKYFTTPKEVPYVVVGHPSGNTPDNWTGFPAIPKLQWLKSAIYPNVENSRPKKAPSCGNGCDNGTCPTCPSAPQPAQQPAQQPRRQTYFVPQQQYFMPAPRFFAPMGRSGGC
jgi:hypothetical protein